MFPGDLGKEQKGEWLVQKSWCSLKEVGKVLQRGLAPCAHRSAWEDGEPGQE